MEILTNEERAKLLARLQDADDDILIKAVAELKERYSNVRADFGDIRGFIGAKAPVPPPTLMPAQAADPAPAPPPAGRENISPGDPAITKIGSNTKAELLALLHRKTQPGPKFAEHLKLLWARGEVKYDGAIYYV